MRLKYRSCEARKRFSSQEKNTRSDLHPSLLTNEWMVQAGKQKKRSWVSREDAKRDLSRSWDTQNLHGVPRRLQHWKSNTRIIFFSTNYTTILYSCSCSLHHVSWCLTKHPLTENTKNREPNEKYTERHASYCVPQIFLPSLAFETKSLEGIFLIQLLFPGSDSVIIT